MPFYTPGFYKLTENILVLPPLYGVTPVDNELKSYKDEKMPHKCEQPEIMENSIIEHTEIFKKVSNELSTKYSNNFIVYNLTKDKDKSGGNLGQVMEYPFPTAVQVDYANDGDPFCYSTTPPQLDSLFLVAIEMSAWLCQDDELSKHIIALHQDDLKSSNVTMILSCLIAFLHRQVFMGGSREALPYIQRFAEKYSFSKMSDSQHRYLGYFDQILLNGFIPLSRPLLLSKIIIVYDANPDEKPIKVDSGTPDDKQEEVIDELEMQQNFVKDVFFRVYLGSDENVVYDQLIEATKKDLPVGETLVSIDTKVSNDFIVKCFRHGKSSLTQEEIEYQIGESVALHSAFVEDNFMRVRLNKKVQLDLIFQYLPGVPDRSSIGNEEQKELKEVESLDKNDDPETMHP